MTDRSGGPQAAAPRGPQRRDPDRAQAGRGSRRGRGWARSTPSSRPGEARGPAHGLRGGRLPQHLRVLGRPRGHLPHRRRPVHPALRLLPDRHRQARSHSTATSRAGSPSPSRPMGLRYATITGVARDDLPDGGAWLYAETVRADPRAQPRHRRRAAHPRLRRQARPARRGLRRRARGARAQRRDGAAHLQADPPGLPLRALPRRHPRRPATPGWSPSPT